MKTDPTARYLTALAIAAALLLPLPASAGNDDILVEGACSGNSDWKLKVGTENNGLDGEFDVDQNVVGDLWRVRVHQNGIVIAQAQMETLPPSGSFTLDFLSTNEPGDDRFRANAVNLTTGESCKGFLIFPEGAFPEGFDDN